MAQILDPFRFVLIALSGWMNGRQSLLIDYLREENRILREQLGGRRLRFTDDQRRRLGTRAKISELVSQEFFMRLFPQARADDSQHLHSFSLLIAASVFAGPVGPTPPMLSGDEWRSSRHEPDRRARRSGRLRQEMFVARKRRSNWLRREYSPAPREANRACPPVGTPPGISGDTPMGAVASHTALLPETGGYQSLIPGSAIDPSAS